MRYVVLSAVERTAKDKGNKFLVVQFLSYNRTFGTYQLNDKILNDKQTDIFNQYGLGVYDIDVNMNGYITNFVFCDSLQNDYAFISEGLANALIN